MFELEEQFEVVSLLIPELPMVKLFLEFELFLLEFFVFWLSGIFGASGIGKGVIPFCWRMLLLPTVVIL